MNEWTLYRAQPNAGAGLRPKRPREDLSLNHVTTIAFHGITFVQQYEKTKQKQKTKKNRERKIETIVFILISKSIMREENQLAELSRIKLIK